MNLIQNQISEKKELKLLVPGVPIHGHTKEIASITAAVHAAELQLESIKITI